METKELKIGTRLEGQKRLGGLITDHYNSAREIELTREKPIAWASTLAPSEILWAMDFCVQYPEAYAATSGARHVAHGHCEITEQRGYERHLCTYCRNSIGATIGQLEGREVFEPLARPDFLLVTNNTCILITKWWEHLSHYWKVPLINIDCPVLLPGMDEKEAVQHVKRQLVDLIKFLEEFTGKKLDYDKLQEIVAHAKNSSDNYREMLNKNKSVPAPATYFDIMGHNFPNLVLRYKPEAAEHYRLLNHELDQRIAEGVVPFANPKYRIYWDGLPYWFAIRQLSEKLKSLGMCLITSTYFEIFAFDKLDPDRALDSLAETVATAYFSRSVDYKAKFTEQVFKDYQLDAGVFAYAMSCKPGSITMRYVSDYVQNKLGVPMTMIEGDLVDETFYNAERNNMKLETLAEMLESMKK
jgi:benzoyl-CoA reductase/2-hydroxyglutaryl-CoA dehydratase subunit BcrC/BadD/HgdB